MSLLQDRIAPLAARLGAHPWISSVKNGVAALEPLLLFASLLLLIGHNPITLQHGILAPWAAPLDGAVQMLLGNLGPLAAITTAYHAARHLNVDPLSNILTSCIVFLILNLPGWNERGTEGFGPIGIFSALVIAGLSTGVHRLCARLMHTPLRCRCTGVKPQIVQTLSAPLPALLLAVPLIAVQQLLSIDAQDILFQIWLAVLQVMDSLPVILLYAGTVGVLWWLGIHGDQILSWAVEPLLIALLARNMMAFATGTTPPHAVAGCLWTACACLGGTGATLGLVLNMLVSKRPNWRRLGRCLVTPACFGINEQVVFGVPIARNPVMALPFIGLPIVLCAGTYLLIVSGTMGAIVLQIPWFTPPVLSAYLATCCNANAALWTLAGTVISFIAYRPFFQTIERGAPDGPFGGADAPSYE